MAQVRFEGYLITWFRKPNGLILLISEPRHSKLHKPDCHRVAIWGRKAEALKPHLVSGRRFRLDCKLSYTERQGQRYTNLTVETWAAVERPTYTPNTQAERDDDWYVPEPRDRDRRSNRLAEGFQPGRSRR